MWIYLNWRRFKWIYLQLSRPTLCHCVYVQQDRRTCRTAHNHSIFLLCEEDCTQNLPVYTNWLWPYPCWNIATLETYHVHNTRAHPDMRHLLYSVLTIVNIHGATLTCSISYDAAATDTRQSRAWVFAGTIMSSGIPSRFIRSRLIRSRFIRSRFIC